MSDVSREIHRAALLALAGSIKATAAAFLCAEAAAWGRRGVDQSAEDEAFDHAVLDETRASFAPVLERMATGALQMLGIDVPPHQEKG